MPTRAPPAGTTGPGTRSIGTPPTRSAPTSPRTPGPESLRGPASPVEDSPDLNYLLPSHQELPLQEATHDFHRSGRHRALGRRLTLARPRRALRRDVDDHPRPDDRERGAAGDPGRPRLHPVQPRLGGERLPDPLRRPAPAGRAPR